MPLMYSIRTGIEKIMSRTGARWRSSPFTRPITSSVVQSRPSATTGPTGQKVSNPLARPHWPSGFCRSRQVTSLPQVKPRTYCIDSAAETFEARRPITTPISASYSTCWDTDGITIVPPGSSSAEGGLKKSIGLFGISLPSSLACAA